MGVRNSIFYIDSTFLKIFEKKIEVRKSSISSLKFNWKYPKKIEFRLHFSRSQGPPVFKLSHTGNPVSALNFKMT